MSAIPPRTDWVPSVTTATIIRTWRDQTIEVSLDDDRDVNLSFPHEDAVVFLTPADARALGQALIDQANTADTP